MWCDKALDTYPSTIKFFPESFMTQEMCDRAVIIWFFVFDSIVDCCKTQEMCDRVASEDHPFVVYCPDKCKTKRICDEAVNDSIAALKLISGWFVTNEMIKDVFTALYTEIMIYFNEDSGNVAFSCSEMGILSIDLSNINLENNFD